MRRYTLLGGLIAAALAGGAATQTGAVQADTVQTGAVQTADDVAAAERAFAAKALEAGIAESFRTYAAPDGVMFRPDPVNVREFLAGTPSPKGPPHLKWWPVWAGIAASGEMGFTTGPATFGERPSGWYFTIWMLQPDGSWRWVLDHGSGPASGPAAPGPDAPLARLAATADRSASAEAGFAEVRAADARLNAGLTSDAAAAYAAVLQDDSRAMGLGAPLTAGRAEVAAVLAARPRGATASPLGGAASKAGDLAYTYGHIRWTADGVARRGHYVRLWQKRDGAWRLLFDEVVAIPPGLA